MRTTHRGRKSLAWFLLLVVALVAGCAQAATPTSLPAPTRPPLPTPTPTATPIPYTAEEILSIGTANMQGVPTMRYMMNTSMSGGGYGGLADGKGRYQTPEQFYLQLNFSGEAVEILSLASNLYYWRRPGSAAWEPTTQQEVNKLYTVTNPFELLKLKDMAVNLQKHENEQVDGMNCYHIQFELEMPKYIEMIGYGSIGPVNLNRANGVVQIWAGKDDLLFRQVRIKITSAEVEGEASIQEKWIFYDFNQPVEIPLP